MAVEKEQLLAKLNTLREIQGRYQQLKKSFDGISQRFGALEGRARELEQAQITAQAEKHNLEARIEAATKVCALEFN